MAPLPIDMARPISSQETYDTLAEAADNDAVIEIADRTTLRVQPFGNCTLFKKIAHGDLKGGNVATFDNGDLKVNVRE